MTPRLKISSANFATNLLGDARAILLGLALIAFSGRPFNQTILHYRGPFHCEQPVIYSNSLVFARRCESEGPNRACRIICRGELWFPSDRMGDRTSAWTNVYASDHTDENIYVSAIIGISGGQGRCGFYPGNVCLPSVSVLWYDPSDGAGY